jgi:hypothetical protein
VGTTTKSFIAILALLVTFGFDMVTTAVLVKQNEKLRAVASKLRDRVDVLDAFYAACSREHIGYPDRTRGGDTVVIDGVKMSCRTVPVAGA